MAKLITTNKRDREKLKEKKRKEKQQSKEERQSNGKASFEDMIAYMDENGQLHSTPPEKQKTEIEVANIEISVPKQENIVSQPLQGRVEHFNSAKGYGFIKDLGSSEKYFFHISAVASTIDVGDKVTFEVERGAKGMNAVRITRI